MPWWRDWARGGLVPGAGDGGQSGCDAVVNRQRWNTECSVAPMSTASRGLGDCGVEA